MTSKWSWACACLEEIWIPLPYPLPIFLLGYMFFFKIQEILLTLGVLPFCLSSALQLLPQSLIFFFSFSFYSIF